MMQDPKSETLQILAVPRILTFAVLFVIALRVPPCRKPYSTLAATRKFGKELHQKALAMAAPSVQFPGYRQAGVRSQMWR